MSRTISRYFMEQWTTNRGIVIDDYLNMGQHEFKNKYRISTRTYVLNFKKVFHRDHKNLDYKESYKKLIMIYQGSPREAVEYINYYGIEQFKRAKLNMI